MSGAASNQGGKKEYARGTHAIAECQRSGQKMRYKELVEDGHVFGLLVHPDWWEPKHPQETPITVTDPIALWRPAPEISIPQGYGDPENLDGGTTPTTTTASVSGTINATLSGGETSIAFVNAVPLEPWNEWLFIVLDGGGFFVSRIVDGYASTNGNTPVFTLPFTTPFPTGSVATAGNGFHLGET